MKTYNELLLKFAGNQELTELLQLCELDNLREREIYYEKNNEYPENRNCLGKLLIDLARTRINK